MSIWSRIGGLARGAAGGAGSDPEAREREDWWRDPATCLKVIRAYHEQSKHGFHRPAAGPYELDWANQPDPFRRYAGARLLPLERCAITAEPRFRAALIEGQVAPEPLSARSLARLFFDSLSLSAWKRAGEARWALRTNPSSGNLHPTEGYLIAPACAGLSERAAVYHYAPKEHGLELRAELPDELWQRVAASLPEGAFLVALTSIHWREAWKYGERAFRYCQHDVGHALAAVSIAAAGLGWRAELLDGCERAELADWLGIGGQSGPDAECADALLSIAPQTSEPGAGTAWPSGLRQAFRELEWMGEANELSAEHVDWDAIELVSLASAGPPPAPAVWTRAPSIAPPGAADGSLRAIVRQRRSALAYDGKSGMSAESFHALLRATLASAGRVPFVSLPWSPRVHLALFVHRVEGLVPGLYWLQRDATRLEALRASMRPEFLWEPPEGVPADLPLSLLLPMDLRSQSVSVSCSQEIAGAGAFSLGMIADYERTLEERGAGAYPRLFWEAGAIGQVLYLEAELLGLRGTGIGCYFDDPMHSILGLTSRALQSLYHFTIGTAVEDTRLTSEPAYEEV